MRKFPSKRILLPTIVILLVLLVVGVVFWPRSEGTVEMLIQDVTWETKYRAQVTFVLTNGTSRSVGILKYSSEDTHLLIEDTLGDLRPSSDSAGVGPPLITYEEFPSHATITNTAELEVLWSPLRQSTFVRTKYKDLQVKGIQFLNQRFPNLLPKTVTESWGKIPVEEINSDWITHTGIVSELPLPERADRVKELIKESFEAY